MAAFRQTSTSRHLKDLLGAMVSKIGQTHEQRPDILLSAWPSLIGERFAPMTKAVSLINGVLHVKVTNSSLLSVLVHHEKGRLMKQLRQKFPKVTIRNIRFSIG